MNITYSWKIMSLFKQTVDSLQDVVIRVKYHYVGIDSVSGEQGKFEGVSPLPTPTQEGFIPFDQLTEQNVIEWLIANVDPTHMQTRIIREIERKLNPEQEVDSLPWDIGNL